MESLQLPMDLFWDGKMEPDSPSSDLFSQPSCEESWYFEDNFAKDILFTPNEIEEKMPFDQIDTEDVIFEFEYDVKKEQWLDVKPHAQSIETSSYIEPPFTEIQVVKLQNSELASELEKFCDVTELTQLTPPQTPPQTPSYINEILDYITQQSNSDVTDSTVIEEIIQAASPTSSYVDYSSDASNSPPSPDIAHGSQIVDEILRTRAQDLPDCNDDNSMYSIISSGMSQSNDSEWTPSPSASPKSEKLSSGGVSKKRVRPYGRGVEDKKSRKKEQNKNAATRYRQKKKQEMEEVLEEERLLAQRHDELNRNVTEIEREVKYLKQLIKEFFKAKSS